MMRALDQLLRGKYTDSGTLGQGQIPLPTGTLILSCLALGALYGAAMGLFSALLTDGSAGWAQIGASAVKVPLLFLSTLTVTFPSLYVVSALARSRLGAIDTLKLLLVAIAVNMALLASLAPVTVFFTLSSDSYPFMILLNVSLFAISGFVGLGFLLRALGPIIGTPPPALADTAGSSDRKKVSTSPKFSSSQQASSSHTVFRVWALIYGVVGSQMGWILRPFIGDPALPFSWFRDRESNVLGGIRAAAQSLFGG